MWPDADENSLTLYLSLREQPKHFVALAWLHCPVAMPAMSEPLALSLGQQFELERMCRVIDSTGDPQSLRGLAKQLLQAWQAQKAATEWMMRQQLGTPSRFGATEKPAGWSPSEPSTSNAPRRPAVDPDVL